MQDQLSRLVRRRVQPDDLEVRVGDPQLLDRVLDSTLGEQLLGPGDEDEGRNAAVGPGLVLGHGATVPLPADTRRTSLTRLLRRTAHRLATHEEVCGGNTESWRLCLSRESIVAWHVRSFATKRAQIERWCEDPDGPPVVRFTDPRHTDGWLHHLERVAEAA